MKMKCYCIKNSTHGAKIILQKGNYYEYFQDNTFLGDDGNWYRVILKEFFLTPEQDRERKLNLILNESNLC